MNLRSTTSIREAFRFVTVLVALASAALLSPTTRAAETCDATGAVQMPAGVDTERLRLLDANRRLAVYVQVLGVDEAPKAAKLPPAMAEVMSLTVTQFNRMFADAIKSSKRFAVFDSAVAATNDQSNLQVDLLITGASQATRPAGPARWALASTVNLSVNVSNMGTGGDHLGDAIEVLGESGRDSGNQVILSEYERRTEWKSPEVLAKRQDDFDKALRNGLAEARRQLELRLRPVAKVDLVEGCDVGLLGGQKFGLQAKDQLVAFRAVWAGSGENKRLRGMLPVALLECAGTGTDASQCKVRLRVAGRNLQEGDYAVVTDQSIERNYALH